MAMFDKFLWLKVVVAMLLGVAFGILMSPASGVFGEEVSETVMAWVMMVGDIFLTGIRFIIVPLILSSVVIALASNAGNLGRLGVYAMIFFVGTAVMAALMGAGITTLIAPGEYIDRELVKNISVSNAGEVNANDENPFSLKNMPKVLTGMLPQSPLASLVGNDMLKIVITALVMGLALASVPAERRKPMLDILTAVQDICMVVLGWVLKIVPYAVFALIANISMHLGISTLAAAGAYILTVAFGLGMVFVLYLFIVAFIARRNPFAFAKNVRELLLLAFSTSSSAAVMPLTMKTTEEVFGVRPQIARFIVPLGTTINKTGTAFYQVAAVFFVVQVFQVDISAAQVVFIIAMATGAALAAPGTPGSGIAILATIMEGVGVPAAGIALVLGVDRILDMCRTPINVVGDVVASVVMEKLLPENKK